MAARYQQLFLQMMEEHRDTILDFKDIHDKFMKDNDKHKNEFNEKGKKVLEIIREYEMKLTAHQNSGQYSKFSIGLSDKFKNQIKTLLPMIDFIGIK